MANESKSGSLGRMNRRKMLGTTTALVGGVVAGTAGHVFGRDDVEAASAAPAASPATSRNPHPPVVQVAGGRLRGLREGKTYSFLGIRYADAERFELPRPVQPWEGITNAQVWGPVCPIPEPTAVGRDEL